MRRQGKFIVLEGGDGSGKSTILHAIKSAYPEHAGFLYTREPGGTAMGEHIRNIIVTHPSDPITELLLFYAARQEHMTSVIRPALEKGTHVICDRFSASTYAYQIYARGHAELKALFRVLDEAVVGDMAQMISYLYVDTPPSVAHLRIAERGEGFTRFEEEDFQERVREGYREFFSTTKNVLTIDGSGSVPRASSAALASIRLILADSGEPEKHL